MVKKGETTPVGKVLFAATDVIQMLRFISDATKYPYLKNPRQYANLDHDYIRLKKLMWILIEKYWDLPEDAKQIFQVREIFYSIGNQYKRLMRVLLMELCYTLDKDIGANLCEDMYRSILSLVESLTTENWEGPENVDHYIALLHSYAVRLLQFMDTVIECEIPQPYYAFFTEEIKEMEDLYGALARRVGK